MAKTRKAIRKKLIAILKGKTSAEDRVYDNPSIPPWEENLPVINIYNRNEDADLYAQAPREYKRTVMFAIECHASGPDQSEQLPEGTPLLSDILDDMCEAIEAAIERDDSLGDEVDESLLTSIQFATEGEGNQPNGSARLLYAVTYYRMAPLSIDKQDGVSDLEEVNAEWKHGHHNASPEPDAPVTAEDNVDLTT